MARQAAHALQVSLPLASLIANLLVESLPTGLEHVDWVVPTEIEGHHAGLLLAASQRICSNARRRSDTMPAAVTRGPAPGPRTTSGVRQ